MAQLHAFLTEYYLDEAEFIVKVPQGLNYEIQHRLKVGRPRHAAVRGAGTIGRLATLALRLRGMEGTTFARNRKPDLNADH